jgi:hypothetical protein
VHEGKVGAKQQRDRSRRGASTPVFENRACLRPTKKGMPEYTTSEVRHGSKGVCDPLSQR